MGLLGATGIGVGSMLGAGVFSDMWVDVLAAGRWYLLALALAAAIAIANALSTAQLAAAHPVAGGSYAYGRAELSHWAGHVAGAAFLVGKTASVAVGAVVLGTYVLPGHTQGVATAAIALVWALNARGITKTAWGATAIAIVVSLALAVLAVVVLSAPVSLSWFAWSADGEAYEPTVLDFAFSGPGGLAQVPVAAAAAFFAFAGYARIATLGEEVREPERTIPRAIVIALAVVLTLYVAIAVSLALHVGYDGLVAVLEPGTDAGEAITLAPLERLADAVGFPVAIVTATAALSVFGAMLAVLAGAGRTAMAMAREADLPSALARQGGSGAPWLAEAVIAVAAIALVWTQGTSLLLVSVATVLTYYAVANAAAIAQRRAGRTATLRVPVAASAFGLVGCVALAIVAAPSAVGEGPAWVPWALALVVLGWPTVAWTMRRRASGPKSR